MNIDQLRETDEATGIEAMLTKLSTVAISTRQRWYEALEGAASAFSRISKPVKALKMGGRRLASTLPLSDLVRYAVRSPCECSVWYEFSKLMASKQSHFAVASVEGLLKVAHKTCSEGKEVIEW
jgi:hypothetical protein